MARLPYTNFHDINLDWLIKRVMKAYTPDNPPDYPVKSVNGQTGVVNLNSDNIIDLDSGLDLTDALRAKQNRPQSVGTAGQVLGLDNQLQPVWLTPAGGGGGVADVKIDQSSIVDQNGVAVIPIAGTNILGVVMGGGNGVSVNASGKIDTISATQQQISLGVDSYKPLTPAMENYAVFYGLARMAGYTQFSSLTYQVYTDEAIDKILSMLGVYNRILSPAGNTHTLLPCPFSYAFGEKAELNITVTANSEYHFSFSCPVGTPTVLTMTGVTATSGDVVLEAGGYYEINVWDGVALYRKVEVTGG